MMLTCSACALFGDLDARTFKGDLGAYELIGDLGACELIGDLRGLYGAASSSVASFFSYFFFVFMSNFRIFFSIFWHKM